MPIEWIHALWSAAKAAPISLLIAFATVLAGYMSKTSPENFKLAYFVYTTLISFIIGLVTIAAGWNYEFVQQWLANGFITWYIWKLAEIIAKKLGWLHPATGPPTTPATA